MAVQFECVTHSAQPAHEMFDRARSIDTHVGSQARSGERATAGVTTGLIGLGEEVTFRARHFGLPFHFTSRITVVDAPHRFVDEQVRGPFTSFRHEHEFRSVGTGSVMIDRVQFEAPLGVLGRLAEKLVLKRYFVRLIAARGRYLADDA